MDRTLNDVQCLDAARPRPLNESHNARTLYYRLKINKAARHISNSPAIVKQMCPCVLSGQCENWT